MAQRYTAKLARLLENCEKKIKFLANNNITVESVAKEKEEKRKRIERHKRAILNMKATSLGARGADALLADILAEEARKKLLQKKADDQVPGAESKVPGPHASEFKETAGGRKTRKKRGGNGDNPLPVRSRVRLKSPVGRNLTTGMTGTILDVENRDGQLLYRVEFDEPVGWDRVIGLIRMVPADNFDVVEEEEKDAWSSDDEEDDDVAPPPSRRRCRRGRKGIASCPIPPRKQGGQRKTRRKRRRKKRKSRRKKKTRRRRKKRKTRKKRR